MRPVEGVEEVGFSEALGRVLAEAVLAPADMPGFDRSAMDGYAVRSVDLEDAPADLEVVGFLPAGRPAEGLEVGAGQAVRIMTGALVPPGADAVQMVEKTEVHEEGARVRILARARPGENVLHRGQDLTKGDVVLQEGVCIRAAEIGALAALGKIRVRVRRPPTISLLSTGDEIVDPGTSPRSHEIRNSNGPALAAAMSAFGLTPCVLATARDDPGDLDKGIEAGLAGDLFLLIGGVSVGDRDLAADRLAAAGVETLFHRVAMKPGKPLFFGRRGRCVVFGLPGNPLSAWTAFWVFVFPAIQTMMGLAPGGLAEVRARLEGPLQQKPGRIWYRLARVFVQDGLFKAEPVSSSGSGDLVSATRANGFIRMPADTVRLEAGDEVRALLWPGFAMLR